MHVLVILKYIPSRGFELKSDCLWSIIDGLAEAGIKLTLATKGKSAPHTYSQVDHNELNRYLEDPSRSTHPFPNGTPDVSLAVCTSEYPALLAQRINQTLNIPFIIHEHRTHYDRKYLLLEDVPASLKHALSVAVGVYAVSAPLARTMEKRGVREEVGVLPNSIPECFFFPPMQTGHSTRILEFLKWSANDYIFGAWTNWRDIKRVDILLEAFRLVANSESGAKLIIAGPLRDPMNQAWVEAFLEQHCLVDRVFLFGTANRTEIHAIAHRIDCCVVPSDFETFSLPALEAQAAGKPVIATRCGGPEDIVIDRAHGHLVKRGDAEQICVAMHEILRGNNYVDSAVIRSRTHSRFSQKNVSAKIIAELEVALQARAETQNDINSAIAGYILLQRTELLPSAERVRIKNLMRERKGASTKQELVLEYSRCNADELVQRYLSCMEKEYIKRIPFLPDTATRILDIGCGMAGFDLYLSRHYVASKPQFYLLDRTYIDRNIWYGYKESGAFYNSLNLAVEFLVANDVERSSIEPVSASADGSVFLDLAQCDLVVSTLSWGFHYPVRTYLDRVFDLLKPGGCLILDVRNDTGGESELRRKFGSTFVESIIPASKHVTYRCIKQALSALPVQDRYPSASENGIE